ncbi:response regulator transcription factor [Spirosoma linguale]|uniref:Two component transcriptional regulator, AraC family n=1 Tax=Spirosoma linguale (strain ATCC 33905 / DSM 74 / LMG 10896 / Claus 1) TaxID=504472 RepID=D2QI98_SPILD|nr:two component transcriptional regulator, AraC family [Spirosoma linguale DSM 74]
MANILLIEDDLSLQLTLKTILELYGHRIAVADNGKRALSLLRYSTPDLIISDIIMPRMDGYTFLERLKEGLPYKKIPVIFLTSKDSQEDRSKGLEMGVISYLTKPVAKDEIISQINNLIAYRNSIINRTIYEAHEDQQPDFQFVKQFYDLLTDMAVNSDFSIEKAALNLFMSTSTLKRRLKNYLDSNFSDLVKEFRLKKADNLLLNSDYSLEQISVLCGFSSLSYFSRSFKASYKINPNQYRHRRDIGQSN